MFSSSKFTKNMRQLFRAPHNYHLRKKLKNKNFSIICCNCIGGIIYHELNHPFLSPTINLFMKPRDYIKFVSNLPFYLSQPITPPEYKKAMQENVTYPIGILHDIKLYFVHYSTLEAAISKWENRKQRINFSNLYFILVERDQCTLEDLYAFDQLPYKNKIVFTHRPYPQIASAYYIPDSEINSQVRDLTAYLGKFTGKRWIDKFDYVNWLNQ